MLAKIWCFTVLGWGKLKSGPKKSSWLRFYEFPKIFASFLAIFGHVGQLCEILSQKNERWHQLLTLPYHFRHIKECFGHTGITKIRLKPKGQVKFGSGWCFGSLKRDSCETQWDPKFSRLFFAVKVPKTKRKVGGCAPNSQQSDTKQEKIQKLGEPSPKKSC